MMRSLEYSALVFAGIIPLTVSAESYPPPDVPEVQDEPDEPSEMGKPCDDGDDCVDGYCLVTTAGNRCALLCVDECASDWTCKGVPLPSGETLTLCQPPEGWSGEFATAGDAIEPESVEEDPAVVEPPAVPDVDLALDSRSSVGEPAQGAPEPGSIDIGTPLPDVQTRAERRAPAPRESGGCHVRAAAPGPTLALISGAVLAALFARLRRSR